MESVFIMNRLQHASPQSSSSAESDNYKRQVCCPCKQVKYKIRNDSYSGELLKHLQPLKQIINIIKALVTNLLFAAAAYGKTCDGVSVFDRLGVLSAEIELK